MYLLKVFDNYPLNPINCVWPLFQVAIPRLETAHSCSTSVWEPVDFLTRDKKGEGRAILGKWRGGRDRKWHHLPSLEESGTGGVTWPQKMHQKLCKPPGTCQHNVATPAGNRNRENRSQEDCFGCALALLLKPRNQDSFLLKPITLVLSSLRP